MLLVTTDRQTRLQMLKLTIGILLQNSMFVYSWYVALLFHILLGSGADPLRP